MTVATPHPASVVVTAMPLQPLPPAVIEVAPVGTGWTMTSSDGLFFGLFRDRTSAVRYAFDEADGHPGHVVIVRDESLVA